MRHLVDGHEFEPRELALHEWCCQEYGVCVRRESAKWWCAEVRSPSGALRYATGGRSRLHAETNALDGVGARRTVDQEYHKLGGRYVSSVLASPAEPTMNDIRRSMEDLAATIGNKL